MGDEEHTIGIGEGALPLAVGVAREAAGALPARAPDARIRSDRRIGPCRSRERADWFVAHIAKSAGAEQTDVGSGHARVSQLLHRLASRRLAGIRLGDVNHRILLWSLSFRA
jgi:hypothetical protein